RVKAPEAAPFMLELRVNSRAPALARQWLDEQPGNAVAGLLPVAAGRGKLADAAVEYLRDARRQRLADFIQQQLKGAPAEVADRVRREVLEHAEKVYEPFDDRKTPEWLRAALNVPPGKPGKLPDWVNPLNLPPVTAGERRLNDDQVRALLAALQAS